MRTRCFCGLVLAAAFSVFSCASSGFEGSGTLVGRVCSKDGKPVPGYNLSFGLGRNVKSDLNGMFTVKDLESGKMHMTGSAPGWKEVDEEVDFFDRREVLVVQVESEREVFSEVENLLRAGDVEGSEKLLGQIEDGGKPSALFKFYSDLTEYKKKAMAGKSKSAEKIKKRLSMRAGNLEKSDALGVAEKSEEKND